jgi:hypothetical protein
MGSFMAYSLLLEYATLGGNWLHKNSVMPMEIIFTDGQLELKIRYFKIR